MAYTTIDDPSAHFQTAIWTGNGGSLAVTNDGNSDLQPDLVWVKVRSSTQNHGLLDTSRGRIYQLTPNSTAIDDDGTNAAVDEDLVSFDSDGITLGTAYYGTFNTNTATYVGWQWKANGGSTTTNDASATSVGNVDSVYQANTTAGFSIVTFDLTGDSGDKTIAHGLGQAPDVIIFKNRDNARNWAIHHHTQTPPQYMTLNATDAVASSDDFNNSTDPTSTVFSLETAWHGAHKHVAYCFAEIQGYSKFGSYTGNSNANGTFVYTGFKPAFFMVKATNATENWLMVDNKRTNSFNAIDGRLIPNSNAAEETNVTPCDFVSNGVKFRYSDGAWNSSSNTYIYMAFAEQPFVTSGGVPCTAR